MSLQSLKISVITVCYNAVDTLEETMLSVLNQTYPNIEYIVIDGGSTDGTVDIIKKYADRLAYWVSEPDKGIYDAMNKGLAAATGDYINFMNAGDRFYSDITIESIINVLCQSGDNSVVYGNTIYKYPYGNVIVSGLKPEDLKERLPFCHQSCFIATRLHKDKKYDISFKYCADYAFMCEIVKQNAKLIRIPNIIAVYEANDGISSKMFKSTYREMYRVKCIKTYSFLWLLAELKLVGIMLRTFARNIIPSKYVLELQQQRHKPNN